jgi:hypothetical protein
VDKPCLDCDATVSFPEPGDATCPRCGLLMYRQIAARWAAIRETGFSGSRGGVPSAKPKWQLLAECQNRSGAARTL